MPFEKRVCVLKQVKKGFTADGSALSGAVYAERMGTELTLTPRLLGIAPVKEGRYAIALRAEGRDLLFEWKGEPALKAGDAPSIKGGFAVLVVFLRGEAEPVAFGSCGAADATYEGMLEAVRAVREKKKPQKEEPPFREGAAYDDEAIAECDYFRPREGDADACDAGGDAKTSDLSRENDATSDLFARTEGKLTYYETVREKIEEAFRRFPEDERLKEAFPFSRWVKAEDALLGVVYEGGLPKYLCVATFSPPQGELAEKACFVPFTPYAEGEGVYIIFQSASTGSYVLVGTS